MMKKSMASRLAAMSLKAAKSAAGCASDWNYCQPKEPINLKKLLKK